MRAVILAGGMGTRLRPLTDDMPKPMMPIVGRPILEYIVEHLKKYGITDIAMTLGYKSQKIIDHFGSGRNFGVNIEYFAEDTPLGTAGSVKNAESFIDGRFLVMSGDAFTNVDIADMERFHDSSRAIATMCVKEVEDPTGFGVVRRSRAGRIESFIEKPEHTEDRLVNTGIYVMEREVLRYIPHGKYDFSRQLFPRILGDMSAYVTHAYWSDIGTLSSYYLTNNDVVTDPEYFGLRSYDAT